MTTTETSIAAHTPGPWTADIPYIHAGDTEENLAECLGEGMSDELWANARLIAAAPDLLAALKAMAGHKCVGRGCFNVAHEAAVAAIARAEGRS